MPEREKQQISISAVNKYNTSAKLWSKTKLKGALLSMLAAVL